MNFALFLAALIPPFLVAGYGVAKTRGSWSGGPLGRGVILGALTVLVVIKPELWITNWLQFKSTPDMPDVLRKAFLVAAIPEEIAKFLGFAAYGMLFGRVKRLQDAVLLCVGIGMGFAALENLLYVVNARSGIALAIGRGGSAVPAHGIFGMAMGTLLVAAHLDARHPLPFYVMALLVPTTLHGAYDSAAFATALPAMKDIGTPIMVVVMACMGLIGVALCNTVLPRAAEADRVVDLNMSFDSRLFTDWIWWTVLALLFLLVIAFLILSPSIAAVWQIALLLVLPFILSWDLKHGRHKVRPLPTVLDRFRERR